MAQASVAAFLILVTLVPSEPSAIKIPIARPSSVSFILPMICGDGEGFMSLTGAAIFGASGTLSNANPAATRPARSASICRR